MKLKDIEEDKLMISGGNSQTSSFSRTATSSTSGVGGFFTSSNINTPQQIYNNNANNPANRKKENEFVTFKSIKENQVMSHS